MAVVVVVLGGCASVDSRSPLSPNQGESSARQALGIYALPRALMSVELYGAGAGYQLDVFRPVPGPDSRYRLEVTARMSAMAHDAYRLEVDPRTGLLKSLEMRAQDKSADILLALAQSAGAARSPGGQTRGLGAPQGGVLISQVLFDPLDPASVSEANRQLEAGLQRWTAFRGLRTIVPETFIQVEGQGAVNLSEAFPTSQAVEAACRGALCAPVHQPIVVRARAPNGPSVETVAVVPDPRRLARIDVRRSPFVTRETKASFEGGMPGAVSVDKPSEILAVALLPIQVVRAGLSAASEVIQLRINLNSADRNYLAAEAAARQAAAATGTGSSDMTRAIGGRSGSASDTGDAILTSRSYSVSEQTRDLVRTP